MNSEERFALRKQKLYLEIESAKGLQQRGIYPLEFMKMF